MADTKERIMQAALRLFALEGYEATSVSAIAGALGITKGALYKHYRNKRAIFDSILARMARQDAEMAREHALPEGPLAEAEEAYRSATVDRIITFSRAMFRYWTQDPFAAQFRRMLTLEQFRSPEMGRLYQQYLAAGPMEYVADLLGSLGFSQPREKAAALYAPLFLLCSVYDGAEETEPVLALMDSLLESARKQLCEERKESK